MSNDNREEHCWRIGGPVYMRTDKPCPECGTPDTHTPKSELRAKIEELEEEVKRLKGEPGWCSEHGRQETRTTTDYCEWCRKFAPWPQDLIDKAMGLPCMRGECDCDAYADCFLKIRSTLLGRDNGR